MDFNRTEGVLELINQLKSEELYVKYLKNDKEVFMAFRKNAIDFYYKSSKLFGYTKDGFHSHKKYCFNADVKNEYINISKIGDVTPITNIENNYKYIKENAKNYAGKEGIGTSYTYKFNFLSDSDYILLDTEIAFFDEKTKDRIDLLIFDIKNKKLKFIEAKHFTNSELWKQENTTPDVVKQIQRYEERLKISSDEIIEEYKKYIDIINKAFSKDLPYPEKIESSVPLYMFGFDNNQKDKIEKLLKSDNSLDNIKYYFRGNPNGIDLKTLYEQSK